MEEPKLSEKERELLEPFYETAMYNLALKPVLQRWGNGIAKATAQQASDWDMVMRNRGKLEMLMQFHKLVKHINAASRKKSGTVKPK